jgi:alpha-tubulin suppressor-like RCC1 family protein/lysophospholipase L1-like esterase
MSTEGFRQPARIGAIALLLALGGCPGETERNAEPPAHHVGAGPVPAITAGGSRSFVSFSHSCAIVDQSVQCWGANGNGQLGDGFVTLRGPIPSRVVSLGRDVTAIAAGGAHTCAIRSGSVLCWGKNDRRQIASLHPAVFPKPTPISGLPEPVTDIAAGDEHTCAIARGELYCWGRGTDGELGKVVSERCGGYRASETCSTTPVRVEGFIGDVTHVALGRHHSCAIADARIYCWGDNGRGQLGVGNRTAPSERSSRPLKLEHSGRATAISAGAAHTCALIGARVSCWGAGDDGQLGDGSSHDRNAPVATTGPDFETTHISLGARHSCAIASGRVYCWGSNSEGQLGTAGTGSSIPVALSALADGVNALASGADHSCAVHAGDVTCWGANDFGQLGNGGSARSGPPTEVAPWDSHAVRDRNGDGRVTVVCLGDSNTQSGYLFEHTWCERLDMLLNRSRSPSQAAVDLAADPAVWETLNRGWSGATAISLPSMRRAEEQLAYALEFDAPDVVILAYGTNDLLQHATPEEVLLANLRHMLRARESGVDTFIALVPPALSRSTEFDEAVKSTNSLIRQAVDARRIIDFASGLTRDDYMDDVHFNQAGHIKRASAALAALRPMP